jgi:hypothetical protein
MRCCALEDKVIRTPKVFTAIWEPRFMDGLRGLRCGARNRY